MDHLVLPGTRDRAATYEALLPQLRALLGGETDPIAVMSNIAAALHRSFGWHWVGFYRVMPGQGTTADRELVVGPFQGPVACARIAHGTGVCGTAWREARTLIVPDVDEFPGHIACSALSRSEIVVPVRDGHGEVVAVLDIDSVELNDFDGTDRTALEKVVALLQPLF